MRAYLSEGDRFETVERMHSTFEQVALAEARAILAETEPEAPSWWGNVTPRGRWIDGLGPYPTKRDSYFAALADALRAFVED